MKTAALIAALAADATPRAGVGGRMLRALVPALALSALALVLLWGPRAGLAGVLASPLVVKTLLPLGLALPALALVRRLARPEAQSGLPGAVLAGLAGLLALAYALALARQGWAEAAAQWWGLSTLTCLLSVPLLALAPLAGGLWALRAGAPAHPARAGAAAGLLAALASAAIYTLHCPEDSPLYLPVYALAMLPVVAAGALLGGRLLRW